MAAIAIQSPRNYSSGPRLEINTETTQDLLFKSGIPRGVNGKDYQFKTHESTGEAQLRGLTGTMKSNPQYVGEVVDKLLSPTAANKISFDYYSPSTQPTTALKGNNGRQYGGFDESFGRNPYLNDAGEKDFYVHRVDELTTNPLKFSNVSQSVMTRDVCGRNHALEDYTNSVTCLRTSIPLPLAFRQGTERPHEDILLRTNRHSPYRFPTSSADQQGYPTLTLNYAATPGQLRSYLNIDNAKDDIGGHLKRLDELARTQEQNINYLLGLSNNPGSLNRSSSPSANANIYASRPVNKSLEKYNERAEDRIKRLAFNDVYKAETLSPGIILPDYPNLRKQQLDFNRLNKEKDVNDGMMNIAVNVLGEIKRNLSTIKAGQAMKYAPSGQRKNHNIRADKAKVDNIKREKDHLKNDLGVDLDKMVLGIGKLTGQSPAVVDKVDLSLINGNKPPSPTNNNSKVEETPNPKAKKTPGDTDETAATKTPKMQGGWGPLESRGPKFNTPTPFAPTDPSQSFVPPIRQPVFSSLIEDKQIEKKTEVEAAPLTSDRQSRLDNSPDGSEHNIYGSANPHQNMN